MNINKILFGLAAVLTIAACSSSPDPVEIVTEKAQARWDALVERDFAAAYEFATPGFRERTLSNDYQLDMMRRPLRWESAEVQAVECEEDQRCTASVLVAYRIPVLPSGMSNMGNRRSIVENWIKIDQNWWFIED